MIVVAAIAIFILVAGALAASLRAFLRRARRRQPHGLTDREVANLTHPVRYGVDVSPSPRHAPRNGSAT